MSAFKNKEGLAGAINLASNEAEPLKKWRLSFASCARNT